MSAEVKVSPGTQIQMGAHTSDVVHGKVVNDTTLVVFNKSPCLALSLSGFYERLKLLSCNPGTIILPLSPFSDA